MPSISQCTACCSDNSEQIYLSSLPVSAQPFVNWLDLSSSAVISSTISRCIACGHMQLDLEPVPYYQSVIRSASVSPTMQAHRHNQFYNIKRDHLNDIANPNVLEIGCGDGQYLKILSKVFPRTYGTEKNPQEPDSTATGHIINTHPDDPDFLQKLSDLGPFDLICCFSYLEHLPNPVETLTKIHTLLSPGGIALIEVPNTDYILNNSMVNEIIPDHIHYFTASSLSQCAFRASLRLVTLSCSWHNYITTATLSKPTPITLSSIDANYSLFVDETNILLDSIPLSARIGLWGVGHQALFTLLSTHLRDRVSLIVDSSKSKQHKYIPGLSVPIQDPASLATNPVDYLFIICAGYNEEVYKTFRTMDPTAKVYALRELSFCLLQ